MTNEECNTATIIGKLWSDPEAKRPGSYVVCNFLVSVDMSTNQKHKYAVLNVTAWRELAEKMGQFHKEDMLKVEGYLETSSWLGKDGKKAYKTAIVARTIEPAEASQVSQHPARAGTYRTKEQKAQDEFLPPGREVAGAPEVVGDESEIPF